MELQLAGKVALVTGTSSGIGEAVARRCLENGVRVAGVDQHEPAIADRDGWLPVRGSITCQTDVDAAVETALDAFGRIDMLVNCAGILRDHVLWKLSDEDWSAVLDVNLTGSFRMLRSVVPVMRAGGSGSVVLISSVNGLRGSFGQANYAASKAGVIALARTAALEVGTFGIRVNAIAPGMIDTPMTQGLPEGALEASLRRTPLQQIPKPAVIADAALFLCSSLSRHITGTVLTVDGGLLAG